MELASTLRVVGSDGGGPRVPHGAAEELFHSYLAGERSFYDYLNTSGVLIAKSYLKYRPRRYTTLPSLLLSYAKDRAAGHGCYNEASFKAIGEWMSLNAYLNDENKSDVSLLLWARDRVDGVGLKEERHHINHALQAFERELFPAADMEIAKRACVIDITAQKVRS